MKKLLLSALLVTSCYRISDKIEPTLAPTIEESQINSLPSPFPSLSMKEKQEDWGKELTIAKALAHEFDLYPAVSTLKRAKALLPPDSKDRLEEIEYDMLLAYYLGNQYQTLTYHFEKSSLPHVDKTFLPFHDMVLLLYDSYRNIRDFESMNKMRQVIDENYPGTQKKLLLSDSLITGNIDELEALAPTHPSIQNLLDVYKKEKKSPFTAQLLNALIPGSGYLYIGQKRSAITSFLLNGLFIAATVRFFQLDYTAAGIITLSFEAGWYFGGIYGAGLETKYYNEKVYQKYASQLLHQEKLFPIFMLEYSF
ncbi:MAG: tetratricopeptide repeat protein [Parachlamydiales bacterium]|nr:tetratricopeptide repeat protein [Parachlamydiales bacterium]